MLYFIFLVCTEIFVPLFSPASSPASARALWSLHIHPVKILLLRMDSCTADGILDNPNQKHCMSNSNIGKRVRVFWQSEGEWFEGKIQSLTEENFFVIAYDDGDEEVIESLDAPGVELVPTSPSSPSQKPAMFSPTKRPLYRGNSSGYRGVVKAHQRAVKYCFGIKHKGVNGRIHECGPSRDTAKQAAEDYLKREVEIRGAVRVCCNCNGEYNVPSESTDQGNASWRCPSFTGCSNSSKKKSHKRKLVTSTTTTPPVATLSTLVALVAAKDAKIAALAEEKDVLAKEFKTVKKELEKFKKEKVKIKEEKVKIKVEDDIDTDNES